MYKHIAIDPGSSSGAIAGIDEHDVVTVVNMPGTMLDQFNFLRDAKYNNSVITCCLEDVGGTRPGNMAKSARTFATHVGGLYMALVAVGISTFRVLPAKWMHSGLFGQVPKGSEYAQVKARKDHLYARAQELYPGTKMNKDQADAVCILHWYLQQRKDNV